MLPFLLALQLQAAAPTFTVPRVEADITVDGALTEAAWQSAARLTDFHQYEPVDGRSAEERTEILVFYSARAIHFGIIAGARNPSTIRATLADRDNIGSDDRVTIYLDTFDDRRRAFMFGVNPLGVQEDGVRTEGAVSAGNIFGGSVDLNPDYLFESRGQVGKDGYVVEVRIPFKSLRFPGSGPQRWGINVVRDVASTGYRDTWTDVRRANASFLAQAGRMEGIQNVERGVVIELQPFVTATMDGRLDSSGEEFTRDDVEPNAGVNLRFGFPELSLDATINPDFSQVESDVGLVTVNERFALFIPEKRPFFLEGIELFSTPNQLVYTRRIVSPIAGAKLTGKLGRYSVAYLTALDDTSGQRGAVQRRAPARRFRRQLAVRLERHRPAARLDVQHRRRRRRPLRVRAAVLPRGTSWRLVDATGEHRRHARPALAGRVRPHRTLVGIQLLVERDRRRLREPRRFRSSLGYRRGARVQPLFPVWRTRRARREFHDLHRPVPSLGVSRIRQRIAHRRVRAARRIHDLPRWMASELGRVSPARRLRLHAIRGIRKPGAPTGEFVPYDAPDELSNMWGDSISVSTPVFSKWQATLGAAWYATPIFDEASEGDATRLTASLTFRPTATIRVEALGVALRIDRDRDGSEFARTIIPRLKVEYQPTRALFFRVIGEWLDERQDIVRNARTGAPLFSDGEPIPGFARKDLRADWLISYEPTPGTVAFFGYGSTHESPDGTTWSNMRRSANGFFVKLAYQFRR